MEKIDGKWHSTHKIEDHYIFVDKCGAFCLIHKTMKQGTAIAIVNVKQIKITKNIIAIEADNTTVNTDHQGEAT